MQNQKNHRSRISLVAGIILIAVTSLVGVTIFIVMQRHAEELLSKSLQSALQNRVHLAKFKIHGDLDKAVSISTRPLLIDQLQLVNTRADNAAVRGKLNRSARSLVQDGLSAFALYGKDGQELAHAGIFTQQPELAVPLNFPGHAQLLWKGKLSLQASVDILRAGRVIGKVMMETDLAAVGDMITEAKSLGETGELALCAPFGLNMQCFPSTINPNVLTRSQSTSKGDLLPMAHALAGKTGFVSSRDYRYQEVVAAYAPVGDFGLGMVLKMDSAELYAPVWNQLRYLIPLLVGILVIALLLLRWLLTPLVVRLVRSEAEAREMSANLIDREIMTRAITEGMAEGQITTTTDDIVLEANAAALHLFGYEKSELIGRDVSELVPERHRRQYKDTTAALGAQPEAFRIPGREVRSLRKDGSEFTASMSFTDVQVGGRRLFTALILDITKKKESEELIWQQANFDTLTGLPNRRMFYDRLEQEIKKSHRSGLPMALLLLDLDHFKEVNDTLGHAQGDLLLVEAARRITECVRESDTVARLGGDEFSVILSGAVDVNSVERSAQNIIERLAAPFQLLQDRAYVSASVGITLYPDDAQNIDSLIKNADQAMYLAKNSGRNRSRYFTATLQEAAQTRLRLSNDLRDALAGQQFRVFYQPIVTLANGAIHKAEALLRWQHPTRGLISPAEFIPLAEKNGMIIDIGDWVFREVASQAAHWHASHYPKFQISINISPVQFRHHGTNFKAWLDYLQELGLPGQNIVIEITEGLLLDAQPSVTDQLLAFRDAGIRVSLDDFGTGYSSLSYLKKFDIDYLKIDQSFVRSLEQDPDDQALCEAIIVMAHKLGLKVIAEGVETERQRDLLAAYGCDYAQGWLYSKAVPSEQFEALLQGQGQAK